MSLDRCDLLCIDLPRAEAVRAALLDAQESHEPAALAAKAFSDPTRLALAHALALGDELCVCDLSWISGRSQNLVSHHVRVLRQAGLANARRDGKIVFYSLTPRGSELLAHTLPAREQSAT
jgi:ArsR family transcriptional regulator, lead/cadmium/zinc/bismuth-responsive transcriptional repressor